MSAGSGDLLEREGELQALGHAIDRAVAGEGSRVVVEGPAGIGTTRLLTVGVGLAQAAGMRALHAVGDEVVMESAFAVVRELLWPVVDGPPADLFAGAARLAEPVFRAAAEVGESGGSAAVVRRGGLALPSPPTAWCPATWTRCARPSPPSRPRARSSRTRATSPTSAPCSGAW